MAQKRFTKITVKGEGVKIHWEKILDDHNVKESVLKSADSPHEDFITAMQSLSKVVRNILGWADDYAEHTLKVNQVSFSHHDDTEVKGAVITGIVGLDTADAPFCFNTPHIPYDQYSESGCSPTMPLFAQALLARVEQEADAYIHGKRAQLGLGL
jgi:hypothetical protein